jgi:hypothetical protein
MRVCLASVKKTIFFLRYWILVGVIMVYFYGFSNTRFSRHNRPNDVHDSSIKSLPIPPKQIQIKPVTQAPKPIVLQTPRPLNPQNFSEYPLDRPDFRELVENAVYNDTIPYDVELLNPFIYNFTTTEDDKCGNEHIDVMIVVKSRVSSIFHRQVIRNTWADEQRFKTRINVTIKRVFVIGSCEENEECFEKVNNESRRHRDIVQVDFIDRYSNNTIKTMSMFKWLVDNCAQAKYAFFTDDDSYVSMKNLLHYLNDPVNDYLNVLPSGFKPYDGRLYAGWVARNRFPDRNPKSKWGVTRQQYPFDKYPDFVAGLAYVMSNDAFRQIQAGIQFVKSFWIDDTYFGLIANKLDIPLVHSKRFINNDKPYRPDYFQDIIAYHCRGDYKLMLRIWNEQYSRGIA